MTTFTNSASVSDTVAITGLSSVASAAYSAPSTLVNNTPGGSRGAMMRGLLRLSFSGSLTAGSGSPYITTFRLVAADGTNLPTPPGASAAAPSPNALQSIAQLVASGGFQSVDFGPFDLEPLKYGFQIFNGAGVAFSGTATLTLVRWTPVGS